MGATVNQGSEVDSYPSVSELAQLKPEKKIFVQKRSIKPTNATLMHDLLTAEIELGLSMLA